MKWINQRTRVVKPGNLLWAELHFRLVPVLGGQTKKRPANTILATRSCQRIWTFKTISSRRGFPLPTQPFRNRAQCFSIQNNCQSGRLRDVLSKLRNARIEGRRAPVAGFLVITITSRAIAINIQSGLKHVARRRERISNLRSLTGKQKRSTCAAPSLFPTPAAQPLPSPAKSRKHRSGRQRVGRPGLQGLCHPDFVTRSNDTTCPSSMRKKSHAA